MKIIINQFFGLGDVIFCMTIARRRMAEDNEIIWPVMPNFVEGLQRAYPDVKFVNYLDWKIDYENRNEHDVVLNGIRYRVIPLRWNVENMKVPYSSCMSSKYQYVGMDWKDWKELANWQRDPEREYDLLYKVVQQTPYVLVNENFQSDFKGKKRIAPKTDKEIVYMSQIEGYSLFDWYLVILNSDAIYTVSTSLLYVLEIMDLQLKEIHLFERPTDPGFKQVNYLFTLPYILHYG